MLITLLFTFLALAAVRLLTELLLKVLRWRRHAEDWGEFNTFFGPGTESFPNSDYFSAHPHGSDFGGHGGFDGGGHRH